MRSRTNAYAIWICLAIICGAISAVAFDFGAIEAHRVVSHTFVLSNATGRALSVTDVNASCACLDVKADQRSIPPDGLLAVPVTMRLAGMEGEIAKAVTLRFSSNDQVAGEMARSATPTAASVASPIAITNEFMTLELHGTVRLRLGLKPLDAAFGVVSATETGKTVTAALSGGAATKSRILSIGGVTNPVFSVTVLPNDRAVLVSLPEGRSLPCGPVSEVWTVMTTDAEVPLIRFPVSAVFTSDVDAVPRRLTVSRREGRVSRQVLLRPAKGRKPFQVLKAETLPRLWGKTEIRRRPLGGWQVLVREMDVDMIRQMSKPPFLRITTDLESEKTLEIPLRVED